MEFSKQPKNESSNSSSTNLKDNSEIKGSNTQGYKHSKIISWDKASKMINKYDQHEGRLMRETDINGQYTKLDGFVVDVEDIRALIDQQDKNITDIAIYFGIREQDLDETDPNKQAFTLILVGKEGRTLIHDGVVVNYCEPIP